ncbi:hypothetical protein KIW84_065937 [Lathyrus oleraceus]|uniref:Uncharacterized protein n=1 Tax=Pisum sativum TaxID=3888 RepID=A0A9D5AAZ9_PEA|nr:hypothetical protein KIW84_065937 [Pisum sativum]
MSSDKQQKQSKNIKGVGPSKSSTSQNIPTSTTITVGDREYITAPKLLKEQKAIFASQVMVPFLLSGNALGFLGPLVSEEHLEKCAQFFPCHHTTKPIANKTLSSKDNEDLNQREAFQLDFITDSFRPFRSCPTLDKSYLAWLTKVEKKKASLWKELVVERKVAKKEKPVAKASSTNASRPTTSSSQGVPSGAAPEKTKKSSKGSGKPPLTPKKRKTPPANVILKTPSQSSGAAGLEHIGSNASDPEVQQDKATTPLISTVNQSDPSSGMNPSPSPTVSSAIQNKGSSTGAHNLEEDNAQNEEGTSSPGEDGKRDSKHVDKKDSTGKENSENTPSDSPTRVAFLSNDADEDDQDSDEIEGNANVDTVPHPTKVRPSITQTSPTPLTEEEKRSLKQNDPLKYVRLMMDKRESSSEQSVSGASTQSGASANEASHDELLQQFKRLPNAESELLLLHVLVVLESADTATERPRSCEGVELEYACRVYGVVVWKPS